MTSKERFIRGTALGIMAFSVETAFQLAHVIAQETITVKGVPIEVPKDAIIGRSYRVEETCRQAHPENALEACGEMEKVVLSFGDTLGSVVLETGEIYMVKGERDSFDFISDAIQEASR